jgi:DNA invertase Pin-like site-specific DNA recombinase
MDSAGIYARVSADVDDTAKGVAQQVEDCRALAADRGWPMGGEYVDNGVDPDSSRNLAYRSSGN